MPCFTLRDSTERPVTVELGTNVLLGLEPHRIAEIPTLLDARARAAADPALGRARRRAGGRRARTFLAARPTARRAVG